MKLLLVDDERSALEELSCLCRGVSGAEVCAALTDPVQALDYAAREAVDVVFLDTCIAGSSGFELLERLRTLRPGLQAVFVTSHKEHALDAWQADACGYLLKPPGLEQVRRVLDKARRLQEREGLALVELRTFGRFDLFCGGETVVFKSRKAKELLALLTARQGGTVSMDLAIETLWEGEAYGDPVKVKLRKAVMNLRETLAPLGLLWMLNARRGLLWLECGGIRCDYFQLMAGDREAAHQFQGQFMMDYSWSEFYLPQVQHRVRVLLTRPKKTFHGL